MRRIGFDIRAARRADLGGDREAAGLQRGLEAGSSGRALPARGRDVSRHHVRIARLARGEQERFAVGFLGEQLFVFAVPVVDPRALAPLALVDRTLQAAHVADVTFGVGALEGHEPDAAHARVHLAAAVDADATARPVAQLLGAGHRDRRTR